MTIGRLAIVLQRRLNLSRLPCGPRLACTQKQRQQKRQKSEQNKSPTSVCTVPLVGQAAVPT